MHKFSTAVPKLSALTVLDSVGLLNVLQYVEEAGGTRLRVAERSQVGSLRRCSRMGVRNAG